MIRFATAALLFASASLLPFAGQAHAQFNVNVGYDAPDANLLDGVADADLAAPGLQTTLRSAIQELNLLAVGPMYTINISTPNLVLTFAGAGEDLCLTGDLDVRNNVVIQGGIATIDASALGDRAFHIPAGGFRIEMYDLILTGGVSGPLAGGVPGAGGAIKHDASELIVGNSSFIQNSAVGGASSHGGAIHSSSRLVTNGCYFENNTASGNGGAVYSNNYHGATNDIYIVNDATRRGGAVCSDGFYDTISCIYSMNTAQLQGGGVYIGAGATGSFLYDHFERNDSASSGGGIANAGPINVFECRFLVNHCTGSGGAIRVSDLCTIDQTTLDGNVADSFGGAISVDLSGNATISQIDAFLNIASQSGGAISNGGVLDLTHSSLHDNWAHGTAATSAGGGGLYNLGYANIINSTIFFNNAPAGIGGGILNNGVNSTVDCTSATISNNNATNGSALYNGGGFGTAFFNTTYSAFFSPAPATGIAGPDPLSSMGWNFDADGTGALAGPGDLSGVPGSPWDPMLAPPIHFPGTRGPIMMPLAPSPLRQAGGPGPIVAPNGLIIVDDQPLRPRPPLSADIGAAQEPCRADYNLDGISDVLDFLDFLNDFGNLDPRADVNLDGVVDVLAFLDFLNWFGIGCP